MSFVNYFPVYLDLNGRPVLIVGGGSVAIEKLNSLLPSGAVITVVSPTAGPEILAWAREARITLIEREFGPTDIEGAFMVIAATDVPSLNAEVFRLGNAALKLTNSVDDPVNCNFIMSANAKSGPMQVAISSAGCSPALAQRVRNRIAAELLGPEVGEIAKFLGSWRPAVKRALPSYKIRQRFWESILDEGISDVLATEGLESANRWMQAELAAAASLVGVPSK